jgi:hypothetical protein
MDIKQNNILKYWLQRPHQTTARQVLYLQNKLSDSEDAVKYLKMVIRNNTDINTYNNILRDLDKWIKKK